ncbi:DUF2599 domain-containing protein [[Mycobacterium] wendilense]|uniref:DUF2599 domain-containing protein n=1 Tax=[Mycobacterium] wendilense TaxID=3064284 RepID=A0ABM9MHY3_9MYCO|nr:DUF2599 domain-containing protein [Mycolicibacterium sp. MU0050]CAJ1585650.1 DUF2599 domain-containing protein [Mycolicibacterium sp. MU0050]
MRHRVAAVALAAIAVVVPPGLARADDAAAPPDLIERTEWAQWGDLKSLRVYPTAAGRAEAAQLRNRPVGEAAWRQVLESAPEADLPGMREQFLCHWQLAEFAHPGKVSWNLEPWRPEVDTASMIESGCNPGGTQEPF